MPSYSEPPTPIHEVDYYCTQLDTSSCDDINNLKHQQLGKSKVLASARYNCLKTKREEIARFLNDHANDDLGNYINDLRSFARSNGGLVLDEYRAKIWPVLARHLVKSDEDDEIDYDSISSVSYPESVDSSSTQDATHDTEDEEELRNDPEWSQVALDVHRTLARFPPNISDDKRTALQDQLVPLIVRVLRTNPRADPQLERALREVHLGTMFALSWPLTWFSHSLNHYQQIVRFFDVFLASPPLTPIYVSAAVVLKRKSAILTSEREMPIIHQLLMNMPNELHLDAILSDSLYLASLMPPLALKTEFTRLYRERARAINKRWAPVSRYAITMFAVVGVAGAAYYFNLGNRFALSM
ncbi:Rab-GAP TBC domain-containing protein [Trichostrongylus colubriformis]|uniref:Rab-GAP TBC domain-containing protein n=1 Tax=Trichostrongylus colubriformis TaxID=6319 RepID=A0AAN8EXW9_TRICO